MGGRGGGGGGSSGSELKITFCHKVYTHFITLLLW